jgi:hypothetical protein
MNETRTPETLSADPAALVGQLDSAAIRSRMDALDAERKALVVLHRAALARERALARRRERQEVRDAG